MQYQIKKRNFLRGQKNIKTSVGLTKSMHTALGFISEQTGDSIPEVICEALEQYLTFLAKNNAVPWPEDDGTEKAS